MAEDKDQNKDKAKSTAKTKAKADTPPQKDAPDVPMIPPIMFLLMLMAGITLDWLVPVNFGHGWGALGLLLLIGGLGGIIWCKKLFEKAETNISPDMPTLSIVTDGPYKYSRNPIYVCFLITYAGLAMLADAPVMLALLLGLYYLLDHYVIAREEAYLTEKFEADYTDYKDKTPRWVGFNLPIKTRDDQ